MSISDYSTTPSSNTTINGINIAEGCAPSGINDSIRQMMADLAAAKADGAMIPTGGVSTAKIADLAVTTAKIADTSVTLAKLSPTGTSGQVLVSNGTGSAPTFQDFSSVPAGVVLPYAGTTAPSNFSFCYGQAISRTTYAALFTAIGTSYGSGDGSTTFNLPDMRGRVAAGRDDMGGSSAGRISDGATLGLAGGEEYHTLTTDEIPSHTHPFGVNQTNASNGTGYPTGSLYESITNNKTSGTAGGGAAHNNMQPTIILNYIIKMV